MLARSLQITLFTLMAIAMVWFAVWCGKSLWTAIAGAICILWSYAIVLATQFWRASRANERDPAPKATRKQQIHAWLKEVRTAALVFAWRMPFACNEIQDGLNDAFGQRGRRGVVFLHGFICNRGIWTPWMRDLEQQRRAFVAVTLEPVFGSIDAYAAQVASAVEKVTAATGMPPVLICHSMGGLAARAWLRTAADNDRRVHHIVTIGTPHHGTRLGGGSYPVNAGQMGRHSAWLRELENSETTPRRSLFSCYYSNSDNIVFPASTATLEGADNRLVPGVPHLAMAYDPTVIRESLARL